MEISFSQLVKKISSEKKPILVEFWASWCLPCQSALAILEKVKEKYQREIVVCKVNVDKNPSASSSYKIKGLPTFVLFKNKQEQERKVGSQSEKEICQLIKAYI